jgi:hypothetical protein
VTRELQVRVPRHRRDGAQEERVRVVQDTRVARVLDGGEPAAGDGGAVDAENLQSGFPKVSL